MTTEATDNSTKTPNDNAKDNSKKISALINAVKAAGRLVNTDGGAFYIPSDGSAPVKVDSKEFEHTVAVLAKKPPRSPIVRGALSVLWGEAYGLPKAQVAHTVHKQGTSLYFHTGSLWIFRLTKSADASVTLTVIANGDDGLFFMADDGFEALTLEAIGATNHPAAEKFPVLRKVLLDTLPPPLYPDTREEQQAKVLASWLSIFIQFWANGRPIDLLLGKPGRGKTVVQRLKAKLFYGRKGDVAGGVSVDRALKDIAAEVVELSLVERDDVTNMAEANIDTINRMATGGNFAVSAFNNTLGLVKYQPRAKISLSAYRPNWLKRADLLTRMVITPFGTPPETDITEKDRIKAVLEARPAVWFETIAALAVLIDDMPARKPITRFDDWERVLVPIMYRAGFGEAFESALRKLPLHNLILATESEPLLRLLLLVAHDLKGRAVSAAELADAIAQLSGTIKGGHDAHTAKAIVHDPLKLGQLLGRVEREGSIVVEVTSRTSHDNKSLWTLTPKVELALLSGPAAEPTIVAPSHQLQASTEPAAPDDAAPSTSMRSVNVPHDHCQICDSRWCQDPTHCCECGRWSCPGAECHD